MTNNLGGELLVAMADQGWLIVDQVDWIKVQSPVSGVPLRYPSAWFEAQDDWDLRTALIGLMVLHGLIWPWPPEPDELVRGSG